MICCFVVAMLVDFIVNLMFVVSRQLKSYGKPLVHQSSGILCWPIAREMFYKNCSTTAMGNLTLTCVMGSPFYMIDLQEPSVLRHTARKDLKQCNMTHSICGSRPGIIM